MLHFLIMLQLHLLCENITHSHGRNLVGDTGDVSPHFFRRGDIISRVPHFFSLGFVFGEVSKN